MGSGGVGEESPGRTTTSNVVQDGDRETGEGYCVRWCRYRPTKGGVKETPVQRGCLPDPGLDTNHTQTPVSTEKSFIQRGKKS